MRITTLADLGSTEVINQWGDGYAFALCGDGYVNMGITKREYMAVQIMSSVITASTAKELDKPDVVAEKAMGLYNAFVASLNKGRS